MTTTASSVIDMGSYRKQRGRTRSTTAPATSMQSVGGPVPVLQSPSPDLSEALTLLGRELRAAEMRLIDLAATIDELYAQVDDMARR